MMSNTAGVDYNYWAKMAYWSIEEAVALSLGIDPFAASGVNGGLALLGAVYGIEFARVLALIQRAVDFGLLAVPLIPADFIVWAEVAGIVVPPDLPAAVASCQGFLWRSVISPKQQVRSGRGASIQEEQFSKKSVNTLLRMMGGMAMAVYGFEPGGGRSSVVSEIQTDLDLKGINLDLDTIRKWLREAGILLKAEELRHGKPKSVFSK